MFTFKQVLEYLNISESTLYRLMIKGDIVAYKVGSTWRFKKAEIEDYLRSRCSLVTA